ncbi:efflux RND transporter periplasmic adaptor subunit [Dickeya dianthicola]|uniref:efflux RND transporter periplasmic adaptor subunit n=1 Tax=Dickeya dianthicola TaxID=204039 RepID=UPI001F61AAC4|nr:efflux RND transporter periplasmic adaptor subunit [Dickeya dianthicola]MCI4186960.1 efflux RND transporter periplasmic adaptor subunit [Dickeya dianthicola]
MRSKTFIVTAGMLTVLLTGCEQNTSSTEAAQPVAVTVQTLHGAAVTLHSELTGRVTAAMVSEVRPQVDGIIQQRLFTEGSEVQAGQVLYQIDPASYQATADQAAAALKNAQSAVRSAKLKAERYARLLKEEGVSQQDADDAQAAYEQDVASVAEKAAALKTAQINLAYTRITAPISGRIGISAVTPGALVTASQSTALATIRQLDPIYVDLTQSSSQRLALLAHQKQQQAAVTLTLENGQPYHQPGVLKLAEVAVDEATGSVTLRAEFPNDGHRLLPGMFVRATVETARVPDAILAPQQGILRDTKGNAYALVVNNQQVVERREVETGEAMGSRWLITQGLNAGDRLVTEGTDKVRAGDNVTAVEDSAGADSAMPRTTEAR